MALRNYAVRTATIANGQTTSDVIDLGGFTHVGVIMPAAITGATCSLVVCDTATGTFAPLHDNAGALKTITWTAAKAFTLGREAGIDLTAFRYIKLVSAGAEGAARTFTIVLRGQDA